MKENDKSGLCYVVSDVILQKLGTSHIHGIEHIQNVDACKMSLCSFKQQNKSGNNITFL
jgi:hypothetical protein